jgi:molecular chaperone DnaK
MSQNAAPVEGNGAPQPIGYLGIDFGTSTTHIAVCYVDGNVVPQAVPLGGKQSVLTCLLWKAPGAPEEEVVAYGERALRLWSTMPEADRDKHRYAAVFKPDINQGPRANAAQKDSRAFLQRCYHMVREGGVVRAIGARDGIPVVIGIPAEVSREQKDLTARLAREAGFGEAIAVEEPLGALAFHLSDGSISAAEARRGVVVVDFGGGTLDVAWLDAARGLRSPWGDPSLGGRLFDDLFFTWLLDQNPDLGLSDRDRDYVWQATCRELKERFSDHWEEDGPDAPYEEVVRMPGKKFADFAGDSREFLGRAASYTPSAVARAYFQSVGGPLAELGRSGSEDLICWVRRELVRGTNGHPPEVARVILTGGSSKWPFMRDLAADAFHVDRGLVLRSPQPDTTVGSGLAVYHVLRYRNGLKQKKLHEEAPDYRKKFEQALAERVDLFTEEAAQSVVSPLVATVEQYYLDWYRRGGTLNGVKQKVDDFTAKFDVKARLNGRDALLAKDLVRLIRDHLRDWLKEHGVEREVADVVPDGSVDVPVPPFDVHAKDIAKVITDGVCVAMVGSVFVTVYLAAHGAHIFIHPFTGIPTAILSAAASAFGYTMIEDKIRDEVLAYDWGPKSLAALSNFLTEQGLRDKIAASRTETVNKVKAVLKQGATATTRLGSPDLPQRWQTLEELERALVGQFERVVNQVIEDLGVLEEFRSSAKRANT